MAETTVSDLKVRLEGIRDERSTHANTAYRIGSAMLELLSYAEAVAGSVDLSGLERAISLKVNLANLTELLTPLDSQKNPISWNAACTCRISTNVPSTVSAMLPSVSASSTSETRIVVPSGNAPSGAVTLTRIPAVSASKLCAGSFCATVRYSSVSA